MFFEQILDLSDLSTERTVVIYGAGESGKLIKHCLEHLSGYKIKCFLDTFKKGLFLDLDIIHPDDFIGNKDDVQIVITSPDTKNIIALLKENNFKYIYDAHLFCHQWKLGNNLQYLPNAIDNSSALLQMSVEEARVRAVGARLLIQKQQLNTGFQRLRQLALKYAYIHINDNLASCAFRQYSDENSLVRFYNKAVNENHLPAPELKQQQNLAKKRNLPPVFINTMLKSGTGFLTKVIQNKLNLPQFFTTLGGFPNDWIIPEYLKLFSQGGALTVQHLDASEKNLDLLAASNIRKIYLHIRDPRQATVSYMHHLENNLIDEQYALRNCIQPFLPCEYSKMKQSDKTAWHARNHVPGLIRWTQEWILTADNDPRFEILIIEFNKFKKDEVGTINRILNFFEIDLKISKNDIPEKKDIPHFRQGRSQEWRETFTPQQQEILWNLIPKGLATRFDWKK